MITGWIINAIYILFYNLLVFLPDSTGLNSNITSAITTVASNAHSIDGLFPVYTLIEILKLVVIFEIGVSSFKIINWVLNKVRGSGG